VYPPTVSYLKYPTHKKMKNSDMGMHTWGYKLSDVIGPWWPTKTICMPKFSSQTLIEPSLEPVTTYLSGLKNRMLQNQKNEWTSKNCQSQNWCKSVFSEKLPRLSEMFLVLTRNNLQEFTLCILRNLPKGAYISVIKMVKRFVYTL